MKQVAQRLTTDCTLRSLATIDEERHIVIEHCRNCKKHTKKDNHQEAKFQEYFKTCKCTLAIALSLTTHICSEIGYPVENTGLLGCEQQDSQNLC